MTPCALLVVWTNWVGNVRVEVDRVMFGPLASPLPLSATLCGLPTPLSEMDREAELGPTWPGVNLTLTVQCAPLARVELQLFVSPKSLGFVPVKLIPAMF